MIGRTQSKQLTIDSLPNHFIENERKINRLVETSAVNTSTKHQK